jgi:hypothetical protein
MQRAVSFTLSADPLPLLCLPSMASIDPMFFFERFDTKSYLCNLHIVDSEASVASSEQDHAGSLPGEAAI